MIEPNDLVPVNCLTRLNTTNSTDNNGSRLNNGTISAVNSSTCCLRVIAVSRHTYVTSCFTEFPDGCSFPGIDILVLNTLATIAGYCLEFLHASTTSEAIDAVINGTADVVGNGLSITYDYVDLIEAACPTSFSEIGMYCAAGAVHASINIFSTFTKGVWCCIAGIAVVTYFIRRAVERHLPQFESVENKFSTFYMLLFGLFLHLIGNLLTVRSGKIVTVNYCTFKSEFDIVRRVANDECSLYVFEDLYEEIRDNENLDRGLMKKVMNYATILNREQNFSTLGDVLLAAKTSCQLLILYREESNLFSSTAKGLKLTLVKMSTLPTAQYIYNYLSRFIEREHKENLRTVFCSTGTVGLTEIVARNPEYKDDVQYTMFGEGLKMDDVAYGPKVLTQNTFWYSYRLFFGSMIISAFLVLVELIVKHLMRQKSTFFVKPARRKICSARMPVIEAHRKRLLLMHMAWYQNFPDDELWGPTPPPVRSRKRICIALLEDLKHQLTLKAHHI